MFEQQGPASPASLDHARATVVRTREGLLRGSRKDGVGSWLGVPYAEPPVGALRFRAPKPVQPWTGLRDASRFGSSAPQPFSLAEEVLGLDGHVPASEDCLTLNVWSRGPGGPPRPVMVWLHGGAFLTGAGSDAPYDGHRLAARGDVVVVTLNYRLGALGFLHMAGLCTAEVEENLGLRDQIAGLAWVRDHIADFGGDPRQVTLFGQSAGAMAIGALLGSPHAVGLFARAILQSGTAQYVHGRASADRVSRLFLKTLGLREADLAVLRDQPVERLVAVGRGLMGTVRLLRLPFQPVVDGVVLPAPPLEAVRAGGAAGVPLLIGTNRDELTLYDVIDEIDPAPALRKRWRRLRAVAGLAAALGPRHLRRLRRAYRQAGDGLRDFVTDAAFRIPAIRLAEAQARHAPVFMYRFDWPSPAYGGRLGACHALEVPFVWNTLDKSPAQVLARDEPTTRALATTMQDAWIAFARTGNPQAGPLPAWPCYEPSGRATMIFDATCRLEADPQRAQRLAWEL